MTQNRKVAIVTGSSRGIGAMTARRLAAAGQCVYAGVRDIAGKGAAAVKEAASFALEYS
ncbi:SDR family NAD(P)-dependent oxidoreductase [Novacetimonas hansenii]|uniref:SDR family NAD(P)-dependent oxidoreductase n=1 Tax=Novacetimonas hansenii TaxID=436 RepID=UPI0017832F27|nr:SDR family NAD(P)-dependent oxidoreductase [Novacetimonas hansenii]MBL7237835.1 SDR family NAD(P)-dependent oxidoreductase [Novacetimonas hansenii]QOF95452.1 SDR family NAD(P)-dependent oxidoreductase [Novacetimonas hansenii]